MRRTTPQQRMRDKAVALSHDLDDAARDMVSGRSFAAVQLHKAAKLLLDLAKLWQEQEDGTRESKSGIVTTHRLKNRIVTTRQRVRKRKRKNGRGN